MAAATNFSKYNNRRRVDNDAYTQDDDMNGSSSFTTRNCCSWESKAATVGAIMQLLHRALSLPPAAAPVPPSTPSAICHNTFVLRTSSRSFLLTPPRAHAPSAEHGGAVASPRLLTPS